MNKFETNIIETIQSISTRFLDNFFRVITQFGSVWMVLAVSILFLIFFGRRGTARYLFIMGTTSLCGLLIKIITARQRPYLFSMNVIDKTGGSARGFSFISGHTLAIVVTALSIYIMVSRVLRDTKTADISNRRDRSKKKLLKTLLFVFLSLLTLLVAFSRVYLGAHYLSDVIFALLFGMLCYYVFAFFYDRYLEKFIFKEARNAKS